MSPTSRSRASGGASSPAVARKSETASRNGTSGYQAIAVMERHLATGPFFVGDSYSIADIALYAYNPHGRRRWFRHFGVSKRLRVACARRRRERSCAARLAPIVPRRHAMNGPRSNYAGKGAVAR